MIVCHCRVVTDGEIDDAIAGGATDLCSLAAASGAGQSCGGCLPSLCERLQRRGLAADEDLTAADIRAALDLAPLTRTA